MTDADVPSDAPDVEGPCPFCFRTIRVWWRDPPRHPGIFLHELPMCREFRNMTADEFVKAVAKGQHKS